MRTRTGVILTLLITTLLFTTACGMVTSLLGVGRSSGTVSDLWSDVPKLSNAEKADMEMPLAARLAVQAMLQGKMDFIAYTTSMSAQQVQEYYTKERMQENGWNAEQSQGCTGDMAGTENVGAVCIFLKEDQGDEIALAIVVAHDESTQKTQIFYARINTSEANNQ